MARAGGPSHTSVQRVLAEASKASCLPVCLRLVYKDTLMPLPRLPFPRKTRWNWLFMQGSLDFKVSTESWGSPKCLDSTISASWLVLKATMLAGWTALGSKLEETGIL